MRKWRTGRGEQVSRQLNPRGTFQRIADSVKGQIESDLEMTELPSLAEVMRNYEVSRGAPSARSASFARRTWPNRYRACGGESYARGPSQSAPARSAGGRDHRDWFGVSRPTVTKALENL